MCDLSCIKDMYLCVPGSRSDSKLLKHNKVLITFRRCLNSGCVQ